jgi:hypothetical protein
MLSVQIRYKYTIKKRIASITKNKFKANKNRCNSNGYSGLYSFVICLFIGGYFPIQKFLNIFPSTSSVVISPVISPK